jgi:hypothetical protein
VSDPFKRALPITTAGWPRVVSRGAKWRRELAAVLALLLMSSASIDLVRAQSPSVSKADPEQKQSDAQPKTKSAGKPKATHPKVYTNADLKALPADGVSVVGPSVQEEKDAGSEAGETPRNSAFRDYDKNAPAYWKARFIAARNRLDQDEKALPILQSQLEYVRVQQWAANGFTNQVNSDEFMSILSQIDATKRAIQKDKQALSDLQDEFQRAGGQPGWIR